MSGTTGATAVTFRHDDAARSACGPQDAELVALGVGQGHPAGAGAVLAPVVGHLGRTVLEQPGELLVARPVARTEVEVHAVLDHLPVLDLDEQQLVAGLGVADHALLVAGQVGVTLEVDVAEHRLPPLGELVGVAAVDGRVRDEGRHPATLSREVAVDNELSEMARWQPRE